MGTETTPVSARITTTEAAVIQTEISRGRYINTTDFVRSAIREKIERIDPKI